MDRIRIKTDQDEYVHFDKQVNTLTLCGLETSGDPSLSIEAGQPTNRRVNCPDCIDLVTICKSVKSTEYINPKKKK